MPHALLTLNALQWAQPIKTPVSPKSCLPPPTPVIGNENNVDDAPQMPEANSLLKVHACSRTSRPSDMSLQKKKQKKCRLFFLRDQKNILAALGLSP